MVVKRSFAYLYIRIVYLCKMGVHKKAIVPIFRREDWDYCCLFGISLIIFFKNYLHLFYVPFLVPPKFKRLLL